jgi:Cu/Ag efflux pump CusA
MLNRLIAWSLRNRLIVLAMTLVFFVAGGAVLQRMPVDVFPEFAPPQVVIQTEAPGMAPTDVESLVTYPLESAINGSPGVSTVRSKTSVGLSTITVVFDAATDIYLDRQLINERMQSVAAQLPGAVRPPVMLPVTSSVGWLVKYALVSDTLSPQELRTLSDWSIRPRMLALGGIASAVSIGGEVKQYQVLLDPDRLLAYHISVAEVRQALKNTNVNIPGAFLQKSGQELTVSGIGRIASLNDIRGTVITLRNGVAITVGNIAEVTIGSEIKRGDGAFGDRNAVIGTISKAYGADTVKTTEKVEAALADIRKTLPTGVTMDTKVFRQANFIESAIKNLRDSLLQGALIVIIVLFLFLMNWRASLITFLSMPAAFVGGILVMHWLGVGINSMTLGGLAIAIGEVVDDAIVTVENVVHRLRIHRASRAQRAIGQVIFDAVREIRNSVLYATLIIVLIFVPIFFLQDLAGRIFRPLGIAYIASVMASLVVSVTMVPALCYLLLSRGEEKRGDNGVIDARDQVATLPDNCAHEDKTGAEAETGFVRWIKTHFETVLRFALRRFWIVMGTAVIAFVATLSLLPLFGLSFLPEFREGNFVIAMNTLPGTSLDESMRLGKLVREALLKYPQVVSIAQRAGRADLDDDANGPNFSEFDVQLDFAKDKAMPADVLLAHIRDDLDNVPGAVFNLGQFIAHRMDEVQSGVRAQVAIKIFGDQLPTLFRLGQQARSILQNVPGAVDINLEQQISVPQVNIRIDRDKAARYGINIGAVAEDLQTSLNGETLTSILEGRRSFDLVLRLHASARDQVGAIRDILVDAPALNPPDGAKIPLREVAAISIENEPYSIGRESVRRLIVLGFNVQGRDLGTVIASAQKEIGEKLTLPTGYSIEYGGQFESQRAANRTLLDFGLLALFGAILLLYKAFGNFREALVVLFNLPLAMIGGIVALYLAGANLSVAAMIGFITLFGIATRNGIILVSHYNQLRAAGRPLEEVVVQGTIDRLVPVLMTALTAALGLLPLLFGSPVGKELEVPLAQVVLGGLISATLLNLVVVPTVYNRLERWRDRRQPASLTHLASLETPS